MLSLCSAEAIQRLKAMSSNGRRVIVGITGQPGAGKSTFASALADSIPGSVVIGMDAFHLAHSVLLARGWAARKGAIDTFDAAGYVTLLRRIRHGEQRTIWAPEFRRDAEDAIAGAVAVEPETRVVVTEGNYLLASDPPWDEVTGLCDEIWYVEVSEQLRLERLAARHMRYGRSVEDAWDRTVGSDGLNATVVAGTREHADAVVNLA